VRLLAAALLATVSAPGLQVDLRYATRDNLTGAPLPGYECRTEARLRPRAARQLELVHRDLMRRGMGLRVWDAYRPARASAALVRWAVESGRPELVTGGYIARRSVHNAGLAVDVTIHRGGHAIDMGTPYDTLDARAHTRNATGRVLMNRLTLQRAMQRRGFRGYWREWWHFELPARGPASRLDVPIRC